MKIRITAIVISFFILTITKAQNTGFHGTSSSIVDMCTKIRPVVTEKTVQNIVDKILIKKGLSQPIIVMSCPVVSHCVSYKDSKESYIFYNNNFFKELENLEFTNSNISSIDWSIITILAHELGHLLNDKHFRGYHTQVEKRQFELEADEFAGITLCELGANYEQAKKAFHHKDVSTEGTHSHPPRSERLAAFKKGWESVQKRHVIDDPDPCYEEVIVEPAQYEEKEEQILLKEASTRIEVVPAVYTTEEKKLLIKKGYEILEVVPASFTTQTEQIMVKEPSERLEYVPPSYETVTKQVLVAPASTKWTKGRASRNCLSLNSEDCKVWCLTEVPAQYKTVTKQILASPATTRSIPISAEYKTIARAVTQSPAQTKLRVVPGEYRTVKKQKLQSPATTREVEVPAEYTTIKKKKLVKDAVTKFVKVPCD